MNFIDHETERDACCREERVFNLPALLVSVVFVLMVAGVVIGFLVWGF